MLKQNEETCIDEKEQNLVAWTWHGPILVVANQAPKFFLREKRPIASCALVARSKESGHCNVAFVSIYFSNKICYMSKLILREK